MKKTITTGMAAVVFLLTTAAVHADETACVKSREKAAGNYARCQSKGKVTYSIETTNGEYDRYKARFQFTKCRIKYAAAWEKLKAANPGTTCDTATRFEDNGDGTVTDHLTGLIWEKKTTPVGSGTNDSDRHDVDNYYTWSNGDDDVEDEDGTVFTDFLADLNSGGGFAGSNGWRLPTIQELQTILLPEPYTCATVSCVVPEIGPDKATADHYALYFSATTDAFLPYAAWVLSPAAGIVTSINKTSYQNVRAVRSGL